MRGKALLGLSVGLLLTAALACSRQGAEEKAAPAPPAEAPEQVEAPPAPPAPPWAEHIEALAPAVLGWAEAWSNQDVNAYLSYYSPSFQPPGGMDLAEWRKQRRARLRGPKRIAVTLTDMRRTGSASKWRDGRKLEVVKVRFRQAYESDTYRDEVDKVLHLEFLDGGWKITDETVR